MSMIKDSGERTTFETGAQRDMHAGKGRYDLLPWYGIHEVAVLCENGAIKYGEHNVDKGIPQHSLLDSGARHLAKHIRGETDEDHLRAAAWNILWALQQRTTHPELIDVPWKEATIEHSHPIFKEHKVDPLADEGCSRCLFEEIYSTCEPCCLCCFGNGAVDDVSYFYRRPIFTTNNPA